MYSPQGVSGLNNYQYSKDAANRISSFITIAIWFNHALTGEDADEFAISLIEGNSGLPPIVNTAFKGKAMVGSGLESLVKASMDSVDEPDPEEIKQKIRVELVKRLKAIQE